MKAVAALGGLSNAQQTIVTRTSRSRLRGIPLDAVAAGMRVRIAEVQKPRLTEELRRRLYALPPDQWPAVAAVAESEGGNVVIVERGNQFYASVDQWGTDEAKLYAALTGLTELQRHALDLWYRKVHGSTIDDELEDELSDAELDRARDLMSGDQLAADAAAIRASIEQVGTDEEEIYRALRNKTAEERSQLEAIYLSRYQHHPRRRPQERHVGTRARPCPRARRRQRARGGCDRPRSRTVGQVVRRGRHRRDPGDLRDEPRRGRGRGFGEGHDGRRDQRGGARARTGRSTRPTSSTTAPKPVTRGPGCGRASRRT